MTDRYGVKHIQILASDALIGTLHVFDYIKKNPLVTNIRRVSIHSLA